MVSVRKPVKPAIAAWTADDASKTSPRVASAANASAGTFALDSCADHTCTRMLAPHSSTHACVLVRECVQEGGRRLKHWKEYQPHLRPSRRR